MPNKLKAVLEGVLTMLRNEVRYQKLKSDHRRALLAMEERIRGLVLYTDRVENRLHLKDLKLQRLRDELDREKAAHALKAREILMLKRKEGELKRRGK